MTNISASSVKELREKSGAGMMDCKKALMETGGDLEAAADWLRKKGLSAATKKAGRVAAEGLVAAYVEGKQGGVVEINAETDFVARNETFQNFVAKVAQLAQKKTLDVEALKNEMVPGQNEKVSDALTNLIATIGENMSLRRAGHVSVKEGVVTSYIHSAVKPGMGRIGVLVGLESSGNQATLEELGKKIAMHVAAASPQFLSIEQVSAKDLERERAILAEQARASGRPEAIIEKMVEGRLRKYYEETVLLEQAFVMDPQKRVSEIIQETSQALSTPITLKEFQRFSLGEGIEKEEKDFAAEVQEQLK